jgi:hypothetical protein
LKIKKERVNMKKVKTYKGWTIYIENGTYYGFLPEQSPRTMDYPEWETESLKELQEFIDCY